MGADEFLDGIQKMVSGLVRDAAPVDGAEAVSYTHLRSNVNIENRVVSFDIKELGKQLKKIGMLVVQDAVWNRVT